MLGTDRRRDASHSLLPLRHSSWCEGLQTKLLPIQKTQVLGELPGDEMAWESGVEPFPQLVTQEDASLVRKEMDGRTINIGLAPDRRRIRRHHFELDRRLVY
jgi:hypothetical protein